MARQTDKPTAGQELAKLRKRPYLAFKEDPGLASRAGKLSGEARKRKKREADAQEKAD